MSKKLLLGMSDTLTIVHSRLPSVFEAGLGYYLNIQWGNVVQAEL
jgi:hypothetical protein